MLLLFLVMQSSDTPGIDTTGVVDDTTLVLNIYEIPEIITYDQDNLNIQTTLMRPSTIYPDILDITLKDAFFYSSSMVVDRGLAMPAYVFMPGTDTKHAQVSFNDHLLNDPVSGMMNINLLPVQFVRSMEIGINGYGIPEIDLASTINVYDRPFSTIGFTTGSFGLTGYMVELTRAIDNDCGFSLDGLYRKANGYRSHDDYAINALYANVYDEHLFPMRLDAFVTSHTFGFPDRVPDTMSSADQRMIDISYAAGVPGHNACVLFNDYKDQWHDSLQERTAANISRTYGLGSDHCHVLGPLQILYKVTGLRREITSDVYGSHTFHTLRTATTFNVTYKAYFASLSMLGVAEQSSFYFMPFFTAGLMLTDTWTIFASIAQRNRIPSLAETAPLIDPTFGAVGTNDTLRAESYWKQEIGMRSSYSSIALFRHDFANRIIIMEDSTGFPVYVNSDPWQNTGACGALTLPVYLDHHDTTTYTRCQFNVYGSCLYNEDTIISFPRYAITGSAAFSRQTPRFGLLIAAQSTTVGPRYTAKDQKNNLYSVLAFSAIVRFITLSIAARVDNILDVDHHYDPDYPLAPRSFAVNIQWNFWY
ncbi:TonB-dependent receptor [candidate division WOR-3 bacterium]|nr:TonB-dependent receptor [candidate division WOR-3 bacterium]